MADLDLMLPDSIPPAMVTRYLPAGLLRSEPRWANIRHADLGVLRTYVVPLTVMDGSAASITVLGVELALKADVETATLRIQPASAMGFLASAAAAFLGRPAGVDTELTVPLLPGMSKYIDLPAPVGRVGLRVPRPAATDALEAR